MKRERPDAPERTVRMSDVQIHTTRLDGSVALTQAGARAG